MRRSLIWAGAILVLAASAREGRADSMTSLTFSAGSQSFWGPGASAASLDAGGSISTEIFGVEVGVGFNVDASSGSVSGNYRGDLSLFADGSHDLASGLFRFDSAFDATGGTLSTGFGAFIDAYAYADGIVQVSFPGFPKGNSLNTSGAVGVELGTSKTFSGSSPFDLSAIDLWVVSAGGTLRVSQSSTFLPTSITGTLSAFHAATGTRIDTAYRVGDAVDLALGLTGDWSFSLLDMHLNNSFRTGFDGRPGAYIDSVLGRAELTPVTFDLYDTRSFALAFGEREWLDAWSVTVTDSRALGGGDPVPEPGTWALVLVAGALGLARRARRR